MKNILKLNLAILFLLLSINISSKTIIWDLGQVLFKTNKLSAVGQIGLLDCALYPITTGKSPFIIKNKIFEVLNLIKLKNIKDLAPATDEDGQVLPICMRAWLAGLVSGKQIIEESSKIIENLNQNFFSNNREKRLVQKTINFIFNANSLANSQRPIGKAVKLVKRCKKNNHKLIVLSNWEPESFKLLYNNSIGKQVFQYFKPENIVISGNIKLIKPDLKIFNFVIKKYKLNPKDCIFIDDQLVNINAAKQCGMTGLLLQNGNYKKLKKDLKNLKVI